MLKVVGLETSFLERSEEQKRMAHRPGIDALVMVASEAKSAPFDREISFMKSLQNKLLGELPDEATMGAQMFDAGIASVKRASNEFTQTLDRRLAKASHSAYFDDGK